MRTTRGHRSIGCLVPLTLVVLLLATVGGGQAPTDLAGTHSAIKSENRHPGSGGLISRVLRDQLSAGPEPDEAVTSTAASTVSAADLAGLTPSTAAAGSGAISGYASRASVNTGESISLHVSSLATRYDIVVYRIGWYSGAGSREITRIAGLVGTRYGTPAPDVYGMVEAQWPSAATVSTLGWTTGYYVAAFVPAGATDAAGYAVFVVRNDASTAPVLVEIPFLTYQAYNNWGGRSTYDANSSGSRAYKVSFDRPYASYSGTGDLFQGDFQMIRWLEREGYEVSYATSADVNSQSGLMNAHRILVTAFHDEYWTWQMRENLERWLASGRSAAFLGANSMYWQVRFEPSTAGIADRVMVAFKNLDDPMNKSATPWLTTITFAGLGKPEDAILGSRYEWYGVTADWVVTNAQHWIYAGTGLANGSRIPRLVGYEWDRAFAGSPPDGAIISMSPMGGSYMQNAVARQTTAGSVIFNAATNNFARFLSGDGTVAGDARVEQMTANVLARAGVQRPVGTPVTTVPTTVPPTLPTTVPPTLPTTVPPLLPTTVPPPAVWVPGRTAAAPSAGSSPSAPREAPPVAAPAPAPTGRSAAPAG